MGQPLGFFSHITVWGAPCCSETFAALILDLVRTAMHFVKWSKTSEQRSLCKPVSGGSKKKEKKGLKKKKNPLVYWTEQTMEFHEVWLYHRTPSYSTIRALTSWHGAGLRPQLPSVKDNNVSAFNFFYFEIWEPKLWHKQRESLQKQTSD